MDLLDRIRNTSVESLADVPSTFDDLVPTTHRRGRIKEMIRTVEGADDLVHPNAGQGGGGGVVPSDWSGQAGLALTQEIELAPSNCRDVRSEGQVRYMDNLISWIAEKDPEAGEAARIWTDNVTTAGKWSYDKSDKFSISGWIDRLKAKNAELKANPKVTVTNDDAKFQEIENGYYALADAESEDIHYFRISRFKNGGIKVQEQASDTLHPVRRGARRTDILNTLLLVDRRRAMELYGQTIGHCGRCGRTLTDAESRARGIGPDCWSKM